MTIEEARAAVLTLLDQREPAATICPSQVARHMSAASFRHDRNDWRGVMPTVHDAVDRLVDEGAVRLSWKGKSLSTRSGPYRISRAS